MDQNKKSHLFIGAGKININKNLQSNALGKLFRVFLDRSYSTGSNSPINIIEQNHSSFLEKSEFIQQQVNITKNDYYSNLDIFEFMDLYKFKFDYIEAFRIFEHLDYCSGEIGRLLEACNILTTDGATMEIIVPNAILLSNMLLHFEEHHKSYTSINSLNTKLIINSEFVNCKCDPHGSVWTPALASDYIESEGTWKIKKIEEQIKYANRDIYMKIYLQK